VNAPLWSDGAAKDRFIAIPGTGQIEFTEDGAWRFPEGTVLVKTFSLEVMVGPGVFGAHRIETRLLVFQDKEWVGYSYLWNDAQTDATLVCAGGQKQTFVVRSARALKSQTWQFPSRAECMVCHSRAAGYVLGLNTLQMNKEHEYAAGRDQQLRTLEHLGLFKIDQREHARAGELLRRQDVTPLLSGGEASRILAPLTGDSVLSAVGSAWLKSSERLKDRQLKDLDKNPQTTTLLPKPIGSYRRLVDPYDATADLNLRARSYLHANCAHCHVEAGGGNSALNLHFNTKRPDLKLHDVKPQHDRFHLADPRLIAPGAPERSLLLHRVATPDKGRMPPVATSVPDEAAVKLLGEWIRQER
jgi:hypothetical protein